MTVVALRTGRSSAMDIASAFISSVTPVAGVLDGRLGSLFLASSNQSECISVLTEEDITFPW